MRLYLFIFCSFFFYFGFGQNKIFFQKKKNPDHKYEIETPAYCEIVFLNGKINGYVSDVRDSVLVIRIFNPWKINNVQEKSAEEKKIRKDKTLSEREKESKLVKALYLDSLMLPISAVKHLKFYNAQKRGKYIIVYGISFVLAAAITELYLHFVPADRKTDAVVVPAELAAVLFADYNFFVKRINPHKWQIKG